MLNTPEIPVLEEKDIATPMHIDTEHKMPTTIPISIPTTTTTTADNIPVDDAITAPQLGDTQATTGETDQQENHLIGIDPYIGKRVRKKFEDRHWYEGTVEFSWTDNGTLLYRIKYDDGQCDDLEPNKVAKIIDNRPPLLQHNSTISLHDQSDALDNEDDLLQHYYFPLCNSTTSDYPYLLQLETEDEQGNPLTINSTVSSTSRPTEYPIHVALKQDRARWVQKGINLMNEHINGLHSLTMVDERDIPQNAVIIPGTMICKEDKVDTSVQGEHLMDSIRLVAQD
jgi:hypothetical protein